MAFPPGRGYRDTPRGVVARKPVTLRRSHPNCRRHLHHQWRSGRRCLVASLAHPGGNLTGFAVMEPTLGTKLLGMLKQVAPQVTRVAVLVNPDSVTHQRLILET